MSVTRDSQMVATTIEAFVKAVQTNMLYNRLALRGTKLPVLENGCFF